MYNTRDLAIGGIPYLETDSLHRLVRRRQMLTGDARPERMNEPTQPGVEPRQAAFHLQMPLLQIVHLQIDFGLAATLA